MINDVALSIDIKKVNPAFSLLKFNLTWYGQVMKYILIRYKTFVLFMLLMLAPNLSTLKFLITLPAKNLIALHASYLTGIMSLIQYQIFGMLWVILQQAVFSNQTWEKFLLSLPITKIQKMVSEIFTLLIADILILIPFFIVAYFEIYVAKVNFLDVILIVEKCVAIILLVLLAQLICKKRRYVLFISSIVADIIVVSQVVFPNHLSKFLIMLMAIIITLCQFKLCFEIKYTEIKAKKYKNLLHNLNGNKFESVMPFIKIQIKNLIINNFSHLLVPFLSLSFVLILSVVFLKYQVGGSNLPLVISSCMLINGLILSNLFARLDTQRRLFSKYLDALPIVRSKLLIVDAVLLCSVLFIFNFILLLSMLHFSLKENYIFELLTAVVIPLIFLSITFFPQIKYKRHGFFISFITMPFFMWGNYLLFIFTN